MSLFPARMKKFPSKMKALEWSQHFSHCKYIGVCFRPSMAANSAIHSRIWPNFELILDFMIVQVTFKIEAVPIKKRRCQSVKNIIHRFFRCSRAANSAVRVPIWPNFEHIRTLMVVLIICNNDEDPIKSEGTRVLTQLSPLYTEGFKNGNKMKFIY